MRSRRLLVSAGIVWFAGALISHAQAPPSKPSAPQAGTAPSAQGDYDQIVRYGFERLKAGDAASAYVAALNAAVLEGLRFEAYVLAAMTLRTKGDVSEAIAMIDKAIARVPANRQAGLMSLRNEIGLDAQRRLDALSLIVAEADRAQRPEDRRARLRELLEISSSYIEHYSASGEIWLLRAAAALELDYPSIGWLAGRQLLASSQASSQNPQVQKILAQLERRGWLGENMPRRTVAWTEETLMAAAQSGDAEAAWLLPIRFGDGRPADSMTFEQRQAWFLVSAKQGHPQALIRFALEYLFRRTGGERTLSDMLEAVRLHRIAARHGYPDAISWMGGVYARGGGVPVDYSEAIKWYRSGAEAGDNYDQFQLALLLAASPDPALRDGTEALRWLKTALSSKTDNTGSDFLAIGAAVYAENGNWPQAIQSQEKVVAEARQLVAKHGATKGYEHLKGRLTEAQRRLGEYKLRRPLRLSPKGTGD